MFCFYKTAFKKNLPLLSWKMGLNLGFARMNARKKYTWILPAPWACTFFAIFNYIFCKGILYFSTELCVWSKKYLRYAGRKKGSLMHGICYTSGFSSFWFIEPALICCPLRAPHLPAYPVPHGCNDPWWPEYQSVPAWRIQFWQEFRFSEAGLHLCAANHESEPLAALPWAEPCYATVCKVKRNVLPN